MLSILCYSQISIIVGFSQVVSGKEGLVGEHQNS